MSMGFSGDSDYSSDYTDLMCKTERLERELAEAKAQLAVAMKQLSHITEYGYGYYRDICLGTLAEIKAIAESVE